MRDGIDSLSAVIETDIIIIGCGAAGVQAAIHAARKKVRVVVFGKPDNSALMKAHIENYFGVVSATGQELLQMGIKQAEVFGATFYLDEVIGIEMVDGVFRIKTDRLIEFQGRAVVLAMGISRNKLNVDGEEALHGFGVSYCANCDAGFFKKRPVAVVGDGSAAAVAALLLKDYASKVYWIAEALRASPELLENTKVTPIEIVTGTMPARIIGDKTVKAIELKDGRKIEVDGVFIEMGAKGAAELAMELGVLPNDNGSLSVDRNCRTEVEGVFACGDITGQPWQLAKAVGEGCVAGLAAAAFVRKEKE
jgi:thioredoxin reductase (NADPH)